MHQYNLTDTQKQVLRWIVGEVDAGELQDDEIWFSWTADGTSLIGYKGSCPEVSRSSLDALQVNGLLICEKGRHHYKCALTAASRAAVKSDFGVPDTSFVSHLRPIEDVDHLDEEIRKRCLYSLSAGGDEPAAWDKAVRTATVILEERLREIGDIDSIDPGATGSRIVNLVFGQAGSCTLYSATVRRRHIEIYILVRCSFSAITTDIAWSTRVRRMAGQLFPLSICC